VRSTSDQRDSRWAVTDLIAAVLVALALVVVVAATSNSEQSPRWVLLVVPVVLTWLPLVLPRRMRLAARVAALISLVAIIGLGLLSVGLVFVPGAVAELVAIVRNR
jgi:FtsH-binding integral membrane protein